MAQVQAVANMADPSSRLLTSTTNTEDEGDNSFDNHYVARTLTMLQIIHWTRSATGTRATGYVASWRIVWLIAWLFDTYLTVLEHGIHMHKGLFIKEACKGLAAIPILAMIQIWGNSLEPKTDSLEILLRSSLANATERDLDVGMSHVWSIVRITFAFGTVLFVAGTVAQSGHFQTRIHSGNHLLLDIVILIIGLFRLVLITSMMIGVPQSLEIAVASLVADVRAVVRPLETIAMKDWEVLAVSGSIRCDKLVTAFNKDVAPMTISFLGSIFLAAISQCGLVWATYAENDGVKTHDVVMITLTCCLPFVVIHMPVRVTTEIDNLRHVLSNQVFVEDAGETSCLISSSAEMEKVVAIRDWMDSRNGGTGMGFALLGTRVSLKTCNAVFAASVMAFEYFRKYVVMA